MAAGGLCLSDVDKERQKMGKQSPAVGFYSTEDTSSPGLHKDSVRQRRRMRGEEEEEENKGRKGEETEKGRNTGDQRAGKKHVN
ncbi:hypothetical protein EYF80_013439 [Liparis tanakae]|uniref:Uncharacterized protein n=1 Tax=Liparis tanakae TaxID=230148 RepID=A0A4Z2IEQ3_9TELE|nr:hypothetical protein EYF80_013439 [Liparis tanakae]